MAVARGAVIASIGKSGSGKSGSGRSGWRKSTLLRCINGLEVFQQGCLLVDGLPLNHGDAKAMRASRMRSAHPDTHLAPRTPRLQLARRLKSR